MDRHRLRPAGTWARSGWLCPQIESSFRHDIYRHRRLTISLGNSLCFLSGTQHLDLVAVGSNHLELRGYHPVKKIESKICVRLYAMVCARLWSQHMTLLSYRIPCSACHVFNESGVLCRNDFRGTGQEGVDKNIALQTYGFEAISISVVHTIYIIE